jgi:hypothetical protein
MPVFLNWCAATHNFDINFFFEVLKYRQKHVKHYFFHNFGIILELGVPQNFFNQIGVPRAQKG